MRAFNHKPDIFCLFKLFAPVLITCIFAFYGCQGTPAPPPAAKKNVTPQQKVQATEADVEPQAEISVEESPPLEGYIYDRRDRRDPFIPLILPTKTVARKEAVKTGTIEGYDLSEFVLAAIARMGTRYYALITTPDNRSFSINEGDIIGLNNGKVEQISSDEVVLVEYSRDYRGELKPRKIILEFVKGE